MTLGELFVDLLNFLLSSAVLQLGYGAGFSPVEVEAFRSRLQTILVTDVRFVPIDARADQFSGHSAAVFLQVRNDVLLKWPSQPWIYEEAFRIFLRQHLNGVFKFLPIKFVGHRI